MSNIYEGVELQPGSAFDIANRGPHAQCRAPFGHAWSENGSEYESGVGFVLRLICLKCGTTCKQPVSYDGTLRGDRKYKYADGYKDENKWSRSEWRVNYLLRLVARK